ncbi:MAG: PAS domain S-box protein [Myxococcales bacterium]
MAKLPVEAAASGTHLRRVGEVAAEVDFRALVSAVRDYAIFMLSPEGIIASWNEGAQRIKGYAPGEIIGKHFSVFYPPEIVKTGICEYELAVASAEGRFEGEGYRIRKDGTQFWANVVITAVRDTSGKLVGYAKVTRDLTERRLREEALRESEQRVRLLVENIRDYALFMLDPDGRVASWNVGAERINGYSAKEILGSHLSRFYPPEDVLAGKTELELRVARETGRFEEEGWRVRKDGTRFWANAILTAVRDPNGELRGFAKVVRDLTERRKADEERLRLIQAQEAVRLRDEFLSIAAHELRTPLTALLLQLQSLEKATTYREGFAAAPLRSARRLAGLVEMLLDVSRIATGRLELAKEEVDLVQLARDAIDRYSDEAKRVGSFISLEGAAVVRGRWDAMRLEQVFANLLGNALKYAAGSKVTIRVAASDGEVKVEVADRGPGIAAEDAARVFGRFERAAPARHYGGLGLGLYIARQVVEAHGGTIEVRETPGGGATFSVILPRAGE